MRDLEDERALQAERLAAMGQVASGLAHQGRNALQRSQACLEMLRLQVQDRPKALELLARMAMARRIIEAHDGFIEAANRAGGGAEIVIALPRGPR